MKLICFFIVILKMSVCYAQSGNLTQDQIILKNFGFSYCLTKSEDQVVSNEASMALGGYFQNGVYQEEAYKNIRNFIYQYLNKNKIIYHETGKSAILMSCLDLYNLNHYENIIKEQNKFLNERNNE